jgi:6-phosphogluconolactonase/glucosamine-6-phosphate isomerase/deaminase
MQQVKIKNINLNIVEESENPAKLAGDRLNEEFTQANETNTPILFLTSGGSAQEILEHLNVDLFNEGYTIGVLDERYSEDPEVNNFSQLAGTEFFSQIKDKINIIDTTPSGRVQAEVAKDFETRLKKWRGGNKNGRVLVTQGIGADGHTSGMAPIGLTNQDYTPEDDPYKTDRWVVDYYAGAEFNFPERITTTMSFLREQVDFSLCYATGVKKHEMLKKLFYKDIDITQMPAKVIFQMKCVEFFTDQLI